MPDQSFSILLQQHSWAILSAFLSSAIQILKLQWNHFHLHSDVYLYTWGDTKVHLSLMQHSGGSTEKWFIEDHHHESSLISTSTLVRPHITQHLKHSSFPIYTTYLFDSTACRGTPPSLLSSTSLNFCSSMSVCYEQQEDFTIHFEL